MSQVFQLTHETGDWSEYSGGGGGGRFDITAAAGLAGTYGIELDQDAAVSSTPGLDPFAVSGTSVHRFGFLMALNTVSLASSAEIDYVFRVGPSGAGSTYELEIDLIDDGAGNTKIRVFYYIDGASSGSITSNALGAGTIQVEVKIQRATNATSNDGIVTLYINSTQDAQATGIDNYDDFGQWIGNCAFDMDQTESGTVTGIWYIDNVTFRDDDTAIFSAIQPFRFLGFDADNGTLLVTGLKNAATLQLFEYSDLATLTESGTTSFGSATDSDLDALTFGIFPVVRPEGDGVWYLYGRDGNNVQAQYNDTNGTLGWVDIGPGTATWGTAKYAVALMPAPTEPNDVIIAFQDDDIYRARYGTATWTKMGDASSGLRTAVRHPVRFNELLAGGTAAGTVWFSYNFGVSFTSVGGTAMGTINAFEVSL